MDLYETIQKLLHQGDRWSQLLSSPLSYRVVEGALFLTRRNFPWQAVYQLAGFAIKQTRRAYTGQDPVAWSNAFFPVEITWSLGLCPFSPEVAAAFITSLGFGEEILRLGEEAGYSRDICSFHRGIAGAVQKDCLPRPAALIASSHLCDGAPLLFQNLAELYHVPSFTLDVPYNGGEDAVAYVASQLKTIWHGLAKATGRQADMEALAQALEYSDSYRKNLLSINELRCHLPAPVSGDELLSPLIYLLFAGQGSREAPDITATLAEELTQHINKEESGVEERYRLLWLHLEPYYSHELMQYLRDAGGVLAFEEFNHVYWPPLDPRQPFTSLARKVLSHFDYKPLEARFQVIRELAERYQVDGIVHFSHHGCHQSTGGSLILKDALQEAGWPVLLLDGDCLDGRGETTGGMLTRVQAFLEVLETRKEGCLL